MWRVVGIYKTSAIMHLFWLEKHVNGYQGQTSNQSKESHFGIKKKKKKKTLKLSNRATIHRQEYADNQTWHTGGCFKCHVVLTSSTLVASVFPTDVEPDCRDLLQFRPKGASVSSNTHGGWWLPQLAFQLIAKVLGKVEVRALCRQVFPHQTGNNIS